MSKFITILKNKKKGTLTVELLKKHVDHLRIQTFSGNIILCGPFKNNDKAIILLEAVTIEEAETIVNLDPFIKEGYYQSYELYELNEANEKNNWLLEDSQTKMNIPK